MEIHPTKTSSEGNPAGSTSMIGGVQPTNVRRTNPRRKGKPDLPHLPWNEEACVELAQKLLETTRNEDGKEGTERLRDVVPWNLLESLLQHATAWAKKNGTVVDVVVPEGNDAKVVVVGDIHGQYHDLMKLFEIAGWPTNGRRTFVFNGDFVDRGGWGVECMILLLAWYIALPQHVVLNRGNHETKFCISMYGFQAELQAKYPGQCTMLCRKFVTFFSHLPLGVTIAGSKDARPSTAVFHGGLFRKPNVYRTPRKRKGRTPKRARIGQYEIADDEDSLLLGSIDDLRKCSKGGTDPDGIGHKAVPADILWSDPGPDNGLKENLERGVGLVFGPDITQQFLGDEMLRLVIRSHEGPDARADREGMKSMASGYTVDHEGPNGNLVTVFSAPDYPQFQHDGEERMNNLAAFVELQAPDVSEAKFVTFSAVKPRPHCMCYYDLGLPGSDVEGPEPGTDADSDVLPHVVTPPTRTSLGADEEEIVSVKDINKEDAVSGALHLCPKADGMLSENRSDGNLPPRIENAEGAEIPTPPTPLEMVTELKASYPSLDDKQSLWQSPREAACKEHTFERATSIEEPSTNTKVAEEDVEQARDEARYQEEFGTEFWTNPSNDTIEAPPGSLSRSLLKDGEESLDREKPRQP
mmetsp:Transcript_4314/g.27480  ORF Transcript_4314/g.27480 Transcript_4314/m.27480 type:complete len:639 (+) Transcript_4314:214-2130(+)